VGATEPDRADTACPDTSTPSASSCLIAWSTRPGPPCSSPRALQACLVDVHT
jgi:hypothetical protein